MKFDIIKRLREPPPFTDTSERNLMAQAADEIERLRAELVDANQSVIGFCGLWADRYMRDYGLDGLHPKHFDILEKAGARMDDFRRATNAYDPI